MPKRVMDKVWQYFDAAGPLVGRAWPITYRTDEADRLADAAQLRRARLHLAGLSAQAATWPRG